MDAAGPVPSANHYVYAGDDPVNNVDPTGKAISPEVHCFLYITGTALIVLAGAGGTLVGIFLAPTGYGLLLLAIGLVALVGGLLLLIDAVGSCTSR